MDKEKKPRSIEVKERVKLKIGDKEYVFESNTPTSFFYTDLYDEIVAGIELNQVFPLGILQVVDSAGAVGAEITSASWTLDKTLTSITITGSAVWNSDNPPATLKVLDTRRMPYFQTSLPAGISAQRGLPITVTWDARFSMNISSATGYLAGSTIVGTDFISLLVDILANARNNRTLTLRKVKYHFTDGSALIVDVARDPEARRIYLPPTQLTRSGTINIVTLYTNEDKCFSFILSSPLNVNAGDYISLDIYFA